jgi:hypothetical protein
MTATPKQRDLIERLRRDLNWTSEQLSAFAAEGALNILTLTQREASSLITDMQGVLRGDA